MLFRTALAAACVQVVLLAAAATAHAGPLAAAGPSACTPTEAAPGEDASPAAGAAVLCLINAERALRGVPSLVRSSRLAIAATRHSADMVRRQYFSHVSPGGATLARRAALAGYRGTSRRLKLGETLGWGAGQYASPVQLVKALMGDPSHRVIVLARRYREAGVGLALGEPGLGMGEAGVTLSVSFGAR